MSVRTDNSTGASITATLDAEKQISLLDETIRPLRQAQKKLKKIEDELANTSFLINSGIGSRSDKNALRQTKRELRQRRVQIWQQLELLPTLLEERQELVHQLDVLRRRYGIL